LIKSSPHGYSEGILDLEFRFNAEALHGETVGSVQLEVLPLLDGVPEGFESDGAVLKNIATHPCATLADKVLIAFQLILPLLLLPLFLVVLPGL
jgi:hypothetical protein